MSHFHDLHFSESILCHRLWDVFFPLLIQRSPFDRRQNPLGLYHPHPLFPAVSQKRQHGFSQQVPLLFLLVVSRWATLRSRHVRAVFLALLMAVVTLA